MTSRLERVIETSVTLQYQADQWSTERIALDGIQNHLPTDSGGSRVDIDFLVHGAWIPYSRRTTISPSQIEAIRFADDGKEYSCDLLGVFHSSKAGDKKSVGQFGEGVKMLSAACVREGIDLELRSRDWGAVPAVREFRADEQQIQQLNYNIFRHDERSQGSATTFRKSNGKSSRFDVLVRYVLELHGKVLGLTGPYSTLFRTEQGEILDETGRLYVKGVYVTDQFKGKLLFGYNIAAETNRDRNIVSEYQLNNHVREVISRVTDPQIVKKIIESGQDNKSHIEHRALWYEYQGSTGSAFLSSKVTAPNLWRDTFYTLFGTNAVLPSKANGKAHEVDNFARVMGHKIVAVDSDLGDVLEKCGVKRADTVQADEYAELLSGEKYNPEHLRKRAAETSLTLAYRAGKWNTLRIILDGLANHMPADSGGTRVDIQYLIPSQHNGYPPEWVNQAARGNKPVLAIRFCDDGKGYAPEFLELLYSTKTGGAVGQFGEGLKMYSAAVLRAKGEHSKIDLKLRSRDWAAMPFATDIAVDGHHTKRLNYRVVEGLERQNGSTSTIYNPTADMLFVLDYIQKYVLSFNPDYKPRYTVGAGAVFNGRKYGIMNTIQKGTVFVRDFFMTDLFEENLLFSYNLQTRDINPDRDLANPTVVRTAVKEIMRTCSDVETIEEIVKAAKGNHNDIFEFQTIEFTSDNKHVAPLYKKAFHKIYGEKAVLLTNPFLALEALHQGYTPIEVSESFRRTLRAAGVLTEQEVISVGFIPELVDYNNLTAAEREMLEKYKGVNAVLGLRDTGAPQIYSKLRRRDGVELPFLGFCEIDSGNVYLSRRTLLDLGTFVHVYKHEKGHQETGAGDPTDKFRQFFEFGLDRYVVAEMTGTPRVATTYEERREESIHAARVRQLEHQNVSLQTRLQQATEDKTRLTELEERNKALGTELEGYQRAASLAAAKREEAEFARLEEQIAGPRNPILRFLYFLVH